MTRLHGVELDPLQTLVYRLLVLAEFVFIFNSQIHAYSSPPPATWLVETNMKRTTVKRPIHPDSGSSGIRLICRTTPVQPQTWALRSLWDLSEISLLYINDLKSVCSSNLFLYADDSALVVSHEDKNIIEQTLSAELLNVSRWMTDRLSLHVGKTESIIFGSKIRLKKSLKF